MSATFTKVQHLATLPIQVGMSRILSTFLGNTMVCLEMLTFRRKKGNGHKVTHWRTYRPKLSAGGQGAVWVNSVRIDQYYHLPGASPPP